MFFVVILICAISSITACGKGAEISSTPPPEDTSGIIADVLLPNASDASASEPVSSEPEKTTISATNSTPAKSTEETTSRAATSSAASTPSQTAQISTSASAPSASSAPATSSQTNKPTYTEADYQRIIDTIRTYGEAKGFVWKDDFAFGQAGLGYYGRPNLECDGYDGVINRLKYHCDEMAKDIGACYFKVVKHIYEGNTEFVVLYA